MDNISNRVENLSPIKRALLEIDQLRQEVKKLRQSKDEKIAVIGMDCRFPGAQNAEQYWSMLINGIDAVTEVPSDRWNIDEYYSPKPGEAGKMITRCGGFIGNVDKFDANFFGISPREAMSMDPQQRVLLEVTWNALENANINPDKLVKSQTGVFVAIGNADYNLLQNESINAKDLDAYHGIGGAFSISANRISYFFDLTGPSIALDTACSSSLVALHLACQSLRSNESDMAIVGGVSLMLSPVPNITFSLAKMLSAKQRCRSFDADADGFVRGEGCAVVILKRLSDAIKDNDNIAAVISGSAVNQDGRTNGLTAPNGLSQQMVIKEALKNARLSAEDIGYIEAHGTGTQLGDTIEMQALGSVMNGRNTECYVGSVKTNIGNLEIASGMASLLKTILILRNKEIPPHLHFKNINPNIPIKDLPFLIPSEKVKWHLPDSKRRAGISSFGFGGTNAHVIVENSPEVKKEEAPLKRPVHILSLSAKNDEALKELVKNYVKFLQTNPGISLSDICFTANLSRKSFPVKVICVASTREEMVESLQDYLSNIKGKWFTCSGTETSANHGVALLFPPQGTDYAEIGKNLYKTHSTFRKVIDYASKIAKDYLPEPLSELILHQQKYGDLLKQPKYCFSCLYTVEYALAKMWLDWGITPGYLIGYGIGEYAAAAVAGVFSFEDGLKLILKLDSDKSGEISLIHEQVKYQKPAIPLLLYIDGQALQVDKITRSDYWEERINQVINLDSRFSLVTVPGINTFLEIGTDRFLITQFEKSNEETHGGNNAGTFLPPMKTEKDEWRLLLETLAILITKGQNINWEMFDKDYSPGKVHLPLYPFQRERYWFDGLLTDENHNNGKKSKGVAAGKKEKNPTVGNESDVKNLQLNGVKRLLLKELSRILKQPADRIDLSHSVQSLGLDSIMAIELVTIIDEVFNIKVPMAALINGASINDLANMVFSEMVPGKKEPLIQIPEMLSEFSLSHGQTAMWYQHQLSPESIFNPSYVLKVNSSIDIERLRTAVSIIMKRHPMLRATVHFREGKLFQKIHDNVHGFFMAEDYKNMDEGFILARINDEIAKKIDLETGPLFRILVFSKSDTDHFIAMISHHIITDMWSQAVILNELNILYASSDENNNLAPLSSNYLEYITKQNDDLKSGLGNTLLEYWKDKLSGKLPVMNFPADKPRPVVQSYKGSQKSIIIGSELTEKLHELAKQQGTTLYALLLSAFNVLLHRYSGDNDIIVGTPFAGRTKKEFFNTVGYFVNPLPIRTKISGKAVFSEILRNIKKSVSEAITHQDYPISLLIEKLNPAREAGRTPLFQVMFVYQRAHIMNEEGLSGLALGMEGSTLSFAKLSMESVKTDTQTAPFDITLMMAESKTSLGATLTYNTDLFEDATIERVLSHFTNILSAICRDPEQQINKLSMLTAKEIEKIALNNSKSKAVPDNCIHTLFEKQAELTPRETALIFNNEKLSYYELNLRANRIACALLKSGIKKEDIVAVDLGRSLEMIAAMLGILKAGAAYLPLDYSTPQARKQIIIEDSGAKAVLGNLEDIGQNGSALKYIDVKRALDYSDEKADENPGIKSDPDNLVYVIYTSGSTGKPKGVLVSHRGLVNTTISLIDKYDVSPKSRVIQFASPAFDASAQEIYMTLLTGSTLYLIGQEMVYSAAKLKLFIEDNKITHVTFPPSLLSIIPENGLSSLHTVVSAGEACSSEIAKKWSQNHLFVNGYGPTEASICSSTYRVESAGEGLNVPIGYPIDNAQMYVLDPDLNLLPVGAAGEILIGGRGIARGYLNHPDLTAEKFIPDPFSRIPGQRLYRTGDLAKTLPDGSIEFIGRKDYQLKIRGNRIEAEEIEKVIKSFAGIKEAAVIANSSMDALYAFYSTEHAPDDAALSDNPDKQHSEIKQNSELTSFLKRRLPAYMIPSKIIRLEKFPYTINGKVDRKVLSAIKFSQDSTTDQKAKPQSEIEKTIAEVWEEVLNIKDFGIHDNFFDVGGHSLAAAKVQMKLQERLKSELSILDLFNYPSIHGLAVHITSSGNGQKIVTEKLAQRVEKQKAMVNLQRYKTISKRSS